MIIRKLDENDLTRLREICIQTFTDTFADVNSVENMDQYIAKNLSHEQLLSELENKDSEFYFAEEQGKELGYLKLNYKTAQTEKLPDNHYEIERIYVIKEFLGKKVGQFLFDEALRIGKEQKLEIIWLAVWEYNERAIAFYQKNGFEIFGKHDFVLGSDIQTDLLMKRKI